MKRHAEPKIADEGVSVKGQQLFVDVGGLMKHSSLGGSSFVVIFVADCTRIKMVKLFKGKIP